MFTETWAKIGFVFRPWSWRIIHFPCEMVCFGLYVSTGQNWKLVLNYVRSTGSRNLATNTLLVLECWETFPVFVPIYILMH